MARSRADVLAAALRILDDYGLADLTMRRLADALDVKPGALYWHYENKQALLAAIADAIVAEIPAPEEAFWRPAVAAWALSARHALLAHRDAADIVATARAMGLGAATLDEIPRSLLRSAGLEEGAAAATADTVVHYLLGHVIEEQGREQWRRVGGAVAADSHPVDSSTFGFGLGLLLVGAAAMVDQADDGVARQPER